AALRPFAPRSGYNAKAPALDRALEAAPARYRIRFLAIGLLVVLLLLSGRAVQLAFSGDPLAESRHETAAASTARADIVDRNGVLLVTRVRAFTLTAAPDHVDDPGATTAALLRLFPDLDRDATLRRLSDRSHRLVFIRRGLTPNQRDQVDALGLSGID